MARESCTWFVGYQNTCGCSGRNNVIYDLAPPCAYTVIKFVPCRMLETPTSFPAEETASLHCGGSAIVPPINSSSPVILPNGANVSLVNCQLPCSSGRPESLTAAAAVCSNLSGLAQPAQLLYGMFCVSDTATLRLEDCTTSCSVSVRHHQCLKFDQVASLCLTESDCHCVATRNTNMATAIDVWKPPDFQHRTQRGTVYALDC